MADFCTKCAKEHFGEGVEPDIDVMKEFESLDPGMCYSGYLCEGCGLIVIGKTEEGELRIIKLDGDSLNDWQEY